MLARIVAALGMMALFAAVAGCATTPEALRGDFAALQPAGATQRNVGERVRWGGRLLAVRPEQERTCFEILSQPLDDTGRPRSDAAPGRRFIACRQGFADPAAFPEERPITVTGRLEGFRDRRIGEYDYRFPLIEAQAVHLWAAPRKPDPYPPPWGYDPFWGPYPYPYWRHPYWW